MADPCTEGCDQGRGVIHPVWLLATLAVLAAPEASGAGVAPIDYDSTTLAFSAEVDGRRVVVCRGVSYVAAGANGQEAFVTSGSAKVTKVSGGHRLEMKLNGRAARDAAVTCDVAAADGCLRMVWTVSCGDDVGQLSPWSTGLRFSWAEEPRGARTRPLIAWHRPTGKHEWEVPGDAPYPVLDRQLREIDFGRFRVVAFTSWYDPDWFYGRNLRRMRLWRLVVPQEKPRRVTARVEIIVLPPGEAPADEALLAVARRQPVGVRLETGKLASIFAPGQPLRLQAELFGVADKEPVRLQWAVWDYHGRKVSAGSQAFALPAGGQAVCELVGRGIRAKPGVYFLAGRLTWEGGERLLRATVGVVPRRSAQGKVDETSPFGAAAITANPAVYPDQPDLETVLRLCERAGVRWIRGFGFPIDETVDPARVAEARRSVAALRRHGILPHVQCGYKVPADREASRRFRLAFTRSLKAYKFLSRYIEVGNELNFSTEAARYVELLLRPQFEVMRQVHPEGRVMTMGFGGVHKQWWEQFIAAGGLDYADIISIHPGHHPRAPEFWEGWDGWVFRPQMLRVFEAVASRGLMRDKEVWLTEAYSPSGPVRSWLDLRTAADYMVREFCLALALGARVVEWYQFQDGTWFSVAPRPEDGEWNYGMVYTDLTPKPQYVAFAVMSSQLAGLRCAGRLDLGADDLYGVRFTGPTGTVDVLWSYREKHECDLGWWPPEKFKDKGRRPAEPWQERWRQPVEVRLPAAGPVTLTDIMGRQRALRPAAGKVSMKLTGSPVYVRGLGAIPVRPKVWP